MEALQTVLEALKLDPWHAVAFLVSAIVINRVYNFYNKLSAKEGRRVNVFRKICIAKGRSSETNIIMPSFRYDGLSTIDLIVPVAKLLSSIHLIFSSKYPRFTGSEHCWQCI